MLALAVTAILLAGDGQFVLGRLFRALLLQLLRLFQFNFLLGQLDIGEGIDRCCRDRAGIQLIALVIRILATAQEQPAQHRHHHRTQDVPEGTHAFGRLRGSRGRLRYHDFFLDYLGRILGGRFLGGRFPGGFGPGQLQFILCRVRSGGGIQLFDLSEQFIAQRGGFAAGTVRPLLTGDHALQGSDLVVLEGDYAFQGFNLRLHSHQALLQFGSRQLRLRQFLQRHVGRGGRRHGARFRTRSAGHGSRSGGLAWFLSGDPQRRPCVHSAAGTPLSPGFILLAHHLVRGGGVG